MALTHSALSEALHQPLSAVSEPNRPSSSRLQPGGLSSPFHGLSPSSSRRSSISEVPSSYHSATESALALSAPPSAPPSERKRRPTPISIPPGTDEAPLFSSYPKSGGRVSQLGQHVTPPDLTAGPLKTATAQRAYSTDGHGTTSTSMRRGASAIASWEQSSANSSPFNTIRASQGGASLSRRRSMSTLGLVKRAQDETDQFRNTATPRRPAHTKRRASFGSGDFDLNRWRDMGSLAQLDNLPYGYGPDDYLQKPLTQFTLPPITSIDNHTDLLGLADLTISKDAIPKRTSSLNSHILCTRDVPARTSSLMYDPNALDAASVVSLSEPSLSSPSLLTKSLPSTKTSLSRSVRSGKEGDDLKRAELTQVSRVLLDRRRMILLEIVETEVTYVRQLRSLVHIYLPQLAVLPPVSDKIHSQILSNTFELLDFHMQFAAHMVDTVKNAGMGYQCCDSETLDRVTRSLANLFVREVPSFALYNEYCSGSMAISDIVGDIAHHAEYEAFEKRCQYIASTSVQASLHDILHDKPGETSRARLRFKDLLIAPIQRVCRYPLLLASLLADINRDAPPCEVVQSVEAALAVMRSVAQNADEARQSKEAELKTARIANRLEPHPAISKEFIGRLGTCRLIGTLDVLYHHPIHAPLDRPTKVRYFAALLYRGYLILAKVKRNKSLEVRHFIPLEVLDIIDITEGSLRHSLRLTLRDHNFDLAASCDAEKELWATELTAARDESTVPPFELPSSIPLFAPRSRHSSTTSRDNTPRVTSGKRMAMESLSLTPKKRHTMLSTTDIPSLAEEEPTPSPPLGSSPPEGEEDLWELPHTSEYRQSQPSTVLIRHPSLTTRLLVDRALGDVFSESLATARSKAQLQYPPGTEHRRTSSRFESNKLRRRRSLAGLSEMRSVDVVSEVRGAVIPGARSRSLVRTRSFVMPTSNKENAGSDISRNPSYSSVTDAGKRRSPIAALRTRGSHKRAKSVQTFLTSSSPAESPVIDTKVAADPAIETIVQSPVEMEGDGEDEVPRKSLSRSRTMPRSLPASPVTPTARAFPRNGSEMKRPATTDDYVLVYKDGGDKNKENHKASSSSSSSTATAASVASPSRRVSMRRSLSFFGLKSLSTMNNDSTSDSSATSATAPVTSNSSPQTTPDASVPQTPKRRRSMRLLGQLRGFTPI